jgi:hypothetical protein
LEDRNYDFATLGKRTRKNIRHGLNACYVEPISFECLADEGFLLQLDTLDRQGRKLHLQHSQWKELCFTAGDLPGFEAWGALVDKKLVAAAIVFHMDDYYYVLYQQSLRQFLSENVNNALTFVMTQDLIKRSETKSIFYGLHSLDAPSSLDEFKFRMGYVAKPVRQHVVLHPYLAACTSNLSHTLVNKLLKYNPGNPMLSKAEGMLRFYLQGRLPLKEQEWAECLVPYKEKMLNSLKCDNQTMNR